MVKAIVKTLALSVLITTLTTSLVFAEDKIKNDELIGFETEGTSYTTPVGVTAITRTMDSSFWGPNLKTLNTSKGLKEIGHFTFHYDYDTPLLETVNMEDVEIIGDFAFGGLQNLSEVNTASELKEIRSAAFTNCIELEEIDLQNLEILGNQAFEGAGLVEVTVPGTVKKVEFQAFNLMPNLTKATVEEGVLEIQKDAFQSFKLKEVYLPESLTKIDDFAIDKRSNPVIYAPSGSYAETWAMGKGFKVNGSTNTTPTIPTNPTIPTKPVAVQEMTPYNYTDPNVILNTQWALGKSKNIVKVEEENVIFYSNPEMNGIYKVETWNKETYATHKYDYTNFDVCRATYYIKIEGKLYYAVSNTEGPFELRYTFSPSTVYGRVYAGVLVPRPKFELKLYGENDPFYILPDNNLILKRWTEKSVGEVYILIDHKYLSDEMEMRSEDTIVEKRLIKLDLSTGTYPEPIPVEKTSIIETSTIDTNNPSVSEMTPYNYTDEKVILNTQRGLGETKNYIKIEKESLVFQEKEIYKDGVYDVETWNADTYATYKYGNGEGYRFSTAYLVKINGVLHNAISNENEPHLLKIGYLTGESNVFAEHIEAGVIKMTPTFNIWKYNYANPFQIGDERWTENNIGEVYVFMTSQYVPYEYTHGIKREVIVPDPEHFWTSRIIKLDMSAKSSIPPVETVNAIPTWSNILVNGKEVAFDAYNVNGNNYFKLRDIAMAINNTQKQFGVNWDETKNAINLTTNSSYTAVGGELAKGDARWKVGTPTNSKVYKDGSLLSIAGYNINNNNYFKLRDLAQAFNIGVTWNNATSTVLIDTTIGYTPQ